MENTENTQKEIPKGLGHYEFKRQLKADADITRTWHLVNVNDPDNNKPIMTEDNQPHKQDFKWEQFFEIERPIEVEIGSGKGGFMIDYALARPEINVMGSEWETKWGKYGGRRIARNNLDNATMMRGDMEFFVRDYIKTASVTAYHMYFPDPWPKERHLKRRLLAEPFLREVLRTVIPGDEAIFYWGTDHKDYNDYAMELFESLDFMEFIEKNDAEPTYGIRTNFEKKYIVEGRPIYRSKLRFIHK